MIPFVLASASPARRQTLRNAGVDPIVVVSGVDEAQCDDLPPAEMALQLAELKCAAVASRSDIPTDAVVLGCDSVLEFSGEALGKPVTPQQARKRWQAMRGGKGVLMTGHAMTDTASGRSASAVAKTTVWFADLSDEEISAYVETGEPLLVAGAFTVDGLGGAFVSKIKGDHHNVVGVSLPLVRELLAELGHSWHELWRTATTPQA